MDGQSLMYFDAVTVERVRMSSAHAKENEGVARDSAALYAASGQVNNFSGGQWVVHSTAHRVSGSQKNERNDRK